MLFDRIMDELEENRLIIFVYFGSKFIRTLYKEFFGLFELASRGPKLVTLCVDSLESFFIVLSELSKDML